MHEKKLYSKIIYENMKNKNNKCLTSSKNVIKKIRLGILNMKREWVKNSD